MEAVDNISLGSELEPIQEQPKPDEMNNCTADEATLLLSPVEREQQQTEEETNSLHETGLFDVCLRLVCEACVEACIEACCGCVFRQ